MYEWREIRNIGNFKRSGTAHTPPGVQLILGGGTTSLIGLLRDGTILKYPIVKGESAKEFEVEAAIYEALGHHPRIIGFLGRSEHGLLLERGIKLSDSISTVTDPRVKLRWASQAAEGLTYLHSRGVLHCDFHPDNLLLDDEKTVKICDFQGKIGTLDGGALERVRHCLPRPELSPSIQSDIFALGSTIFAIMTGADPYQEVVDTDVVMKYEQLIFPTTNFVAGPQVLKCWQQEYSCASDVVNELASIDHSLTKSLHSCIGLYTSSAGDVLLSTFVGYCVGCNVANVPSCSLRTLVHNVLSTRWEQSLRLASTLFPVGLVAGKSSAIPGAANLLLFAHLLLVLTRIRSIGTVV